MDLEKERDKPKSRIEKVFREISGRLRIIEIFSDYEITVTCCSGIIDYSPAEIYISTFSGNVKISGNHLNIKYFQQDTIFIEGIIKNISME